MEKHFCWRCQRVMPFFDDEEMELVSPLLADGIRDIERYREEHGVDIETARKHCKPEVKELMKELMGDDDIYFDQLFHHKRSNWGNQCASCGHLLRTPQASFCAECGVQPS